jgi:hypothetical protein
MDAGFRRIALYGRSWLVLTPLILVACSTTPNPPKGPKPTIPNTATIAVVSRGVDKDLEARFNRDSTASGAKAGAGAGAATGLAAAGFCGPFFFLCALGTVPAGMIVGAAGGAAVGAVKDANKKPEREDLERLESHLEAIGERRTLHQEISAATAARVPPARRAPGPDADALVEVSLGDIRFQQDDDGDYQWMMRVNVAAQWNRNTRRTRGGSDHYLAYSPALPLHMWIDTDGSAIEGALDDLVIDISSSIERDLFQ